MYDKFSLYQNVSFEFIEMFCDIHSLMYRIHRREHVGTYAYQTNQLTVVLICRGDSPHSGPPLELAGNSRQLPKL